MRNGERERRRDIQKGREIERTKNIEGEKGQGGIEIHTFSQRD